MYLRNAGLNKSKYTSLLKNVLWTLIYESAAWIYEKEYFASIFQVFLTTDPIIIQWASQSMNV